MDIIFSKQIPLIIKAAEERKVLVQLHIFMQSNKNDSKKDFIIKLTDDQDLLFLYTLRLAESDFHSLKAQQGLLVDFTAFPQKVIDLLEMCIKENSKENPKFVIHFVGVGQHPALSEDAPYVLNIIETNPFRHLNHLSLRFLPGTDSDIKSHLVSCLKQLKETNSLIQHKYEHTYKDLSSQLQETQELLTSKTTELESLKLEWSSRISEVTSKHKEDMAVEKEKTIQFQSNFQVRYERERRELEQTHSKLVKQLEARLLEYETVNKDLTDRKYKSESSIRDYKSKLSTLEEEFNRIKSEVYTLRKENTSIEHSCQEKEKIIGQLQTRVAVLEQELKDKAEVLSKSNDLFDLEKDKKRHLESDIDSKTKEIHKLETKVKAMGDELKKGNEIIKKLQGEVKAYHSKVKLRTQIATEQEKLLGEKDSELEKLRQDLMKTKDTLRDTEDQNRRLNGNLETAIQKLEEDKKLLKTNENMIQWLNKQINEQRVTHTYPGNFELTSLSNQLRHSVNVTDDSRGGTVKKSAIPLIQNHVNTSPTHMINSGSDKDRNPPLDPKFFTKKEEAVPVRGLYNSNIRASNPPSLLLASKDGLQHYESLPPPTVNMLPGGVQQVSTATNHSLENGSVRLNHQMIVPKQPPPLMSAYFPSHS